MKQYTHPTNLHEYDQLINLIAMLIREAPSTAAARLHQDELRCIEEEKSAFIKRTYQSKTNGR